LSNLTDSVVSILDLKQEWVSGLFDESDRENWSTGGELHIDKFGAGVLKNNIPKLQIETLAGWVGPPFRVKPITPG
jgi:hypothetical protein